MWEKQKVLSLTTASVELRSALPPVWFMTPKLRCSRPCDCVVTYVEAKEGSVPPTTAFWVRPSAPRELPAPPELSVSSSKWASTSSTVRAESGSREIGGISNSSSPKLGVWKVCCGMEFQSLWVSHWHQMGYYKLNWLDILKPSWTNRQDLKAFKTFPNGDYA